MDENLNQYWKTVVNTIQDGVMIVTPGGQIVSVNQALEEMTGYGREELIGASCTILGCSSCELARGVPSCHWCVMFEKGDLRRQQCALIRKDGSRTHIVKNASVLRDKDGAIIGMVIKKNTFHGLAPRSIAASSIDRSSSRKRDDTTTAT